MTSFIQNILWNSVSGFVEAGTRTAGGYAGDALIKAGDMIENSGRNVGSSVERRASQYGDSISGQSYQPSAKPLPLTARRPVAKRSNSSPASTKAVGPTSKTPLGANKYPGGKQVNGATGAAKKQIMSGVTGAKSVAGGAKSMAGGVVRGAKSTTAKSTPKSLPKAYPNNVPYGAAVTPQKSKQTSNLNSVKGTAESKANNLPKTYSSGNSFPTSDKKTAVKLGQSKPFAAPTSSKMEDKKAAYPGTDTLPGQGWGRPVNVTKQQYKPIERMRPQAEAGEMSHIAGF